MREIITGILLLSGSFFVLLSALGLIRMPDLFTRMSATTKASTLGAGLILLGTVFYFYEIGIASRSLSIIIFLFLTAPVAAHLIGRAAYLNNVPLWEKTKYDDLKGKYSPSDHTLKSSGSAVSGNDLRQ